MTTATENDSAPLAIIDQFSIDEVNLTLAQRVILVPAAWNLSRKGAPNDFIARKLTLDYAKDVGLQQITPGQVARLLAEGANQAARRFNASTVDESRAKLIEQHEEIAWQAQKRLSKLPENAPARDFKSIADVMLKAFHVVGEASGVFSDMDESESYRYQTQRVEEFQQIVLEVVRKVAGQRVLNAVLEEIADHATQHVEPVVRVQGGRSR